MRYSTRQGIHSVWQYIFNAPPETTKNEDTQQPPEYKFKD